MASADKADETENLHSLGSDGKVDSRAKQQHECTKGTQQQQQHGLGYE